MRPINETHQYECSMLAYSVREPFNGCTDFNVVAAFDFEYDARDYADYLNKTKLPDYPYYVVNVGTLRRDASGDIILDSPENDRVLAEWEIEVQRPTS